MPDKLFSARVCGTPLETGGATLLLPWILAILVLVAGVCGIALSVTARSAHQAEQTAAAGMEVEVPADTSTARLETVTALLRQTHGVLSVSMPDTAATARLLRPWFGPSVRLDELPVPKLIDVHTDPGQAVDVATLRKQLASAAPEAQLDDHSEWLGGLRAAALRIEIVCVAGLAAALALAVAAGVLTAGAALRTDRQVVELAHLLGAFDDDIARPLALRALIFGLVGGVLGAAATVATVVVLGGAGAVVQLPAPVAASGIADWRAWAIAIGAALASGLIAAATAYRVALRRLATLQ